MNKWRGTPPFHACTHVYIYIYVHIRESASAGLVFGEGLISRVHDNISKWPKNKKWLNAALQERERERDCFRTKAYSLSPDSAIVESESFFDPHSFDDESPSCVHRILPPESGQNLAGMGTQNSMDQAQEDHECPEEFMDFHGVGFDSP